MISDLISLERARLSAYFNNFNIEIYFIKYFDVDFSI
jgi:hypothetical protein